MLHFSLFTRSPVLLLVFLCWGCQKPPLPETGSADYQEVVTAFYASIASIQSGEDVGAETNLMRVAALADGEPAVWYNLGLLSLRQNQFDAASERLNKALALAPNNGDILRLMGILELTLGNTATGVDFLQRAVTQNPSDFKARYALAQERVQSGDPSQVADAANLYNQLADDLPENLVIQLERARLAAQQNNADILRAATNVLDNFAPAWSNDVREPFNGLKSAVTSGDFSAAQMQAGFLRNMLLSTHKFRQDLLQVQTPAEEVGDLITQFIFLPSPTPQPAPADLGLSYTASAAPVEQPVFKQIQSFILDDKGAHSLLTWTDQTVSIHQQHFDFGASDIAMFDFNYDFLVDAAVVSSEGILLLKQDSLGQFTPAPPASQFDPRSASQPYNRVWAADIDMEGDLDLVLAAPDGPHILRNNGDGTFAPLALFQEVEQLQDFAWGDFDGDGDPDPALLDAAGELYLYTNERMGQFIRQIIPPIFGDAVALSPGDLNADALMDLVVLMADGAVYTITHPPGQGWVVTQLIKWDGFAAPDNGTIRLFLSDFDNNGAIDVLIAGVNSQVWLQTAPGAFAPVSPALSGTVQSVMDRNNDGLLDFTGIDPANKIATWDASGSKNYHWQIIRPRAGQALGDQRINSFTIGGEVEIRAGLLYQKQPILSPVVHLGLGTHKQTDVARLIWPNGDIQSEFDLAADQSIFTPQRLKGSCPWLFTYDGEQMRFVTDFLWRSPLGLRINAQETAGTMTTEDWVKIRGEALAPRNGKYDVRITAELWETHFFDHVALMAVDHPENTEIFVDERFAFPPPEMKVHHTSALQPVLKVTTDSGQDVTLNVKNRDGVYLDFAGRGAYQGITREHFIEITLEENVLEEAHPMLVAFGWVRPTDSSINVAISQGNQPPPRGLYLEVLQRDGRWKAVRDNLGFPAGKTKTVLIDLAGVFDRDSQPVLRLSTNLEIYWDQISWALQSFETVKTQHVSLLSAELSYRGFSRVTAPNASSPEAPDYQQLAGTSARWRDLEGYYTRFGPVEALLAAVDDRYVIMNAGDEMRFLFNALPAPEKGMRRDFVLVGDGWVKDGDYNTAFSKTVIPLPSHSSPAYNIPPGLLQADPVYQQHKGDWQTYHTRYVRPDAFRQALATRK